MPMARIAVGHQPTSGKAKKRVRPATPARITRRAVDIGPSYVFASIGHDTATDGANCTAGTLAGRGRRRDLGDLIERVDHLFAPTHHVARRDIGAVQHIVESLSLSPSVNGPHQAPMRRRGGAQLVCGVQIAVSYTHLRAHETDSYL